MTFVDDLQEIIRRLSERRPCDPDPPDCERCCDVGWLDVSEDGHPAVRKCPDCSPVRKPEVQERRTYS